MAALLALEVFETDLEETHLVSSSDLERRHATAFAEGFESGRRHALAEAAEATARLQSELRQTIEDLSFSHVAARRHVLASLEPLVLAMTTQLFPHLATTALPGLLLAELRRITARSGDPVVIRAAPDLAARLAPVLPQERGGSVTVVPDESLGPNQAHLAAGPLERFADPDAAIAEMSRAAEAFFHSIQKESRHG
jgi:flagellar assembly protein FliH